MVCYARPALRMAAIILVLLVILDRSGAHLFSGHFFGTAGLIAAVAVAAGAVAAAGALGFAVISSIRRRRAVAGGCVHCQFRCQSAMTGQPHRPVLRAPERPAAGPVARPARPRTAVAPLSTGHAEGQERTAS
jgi:hypothetical protein